ncbi:13547_t:CDS:1 [Ambispora gerdemannii]|uniref:13547_t:CDS:1 n=1 Tax=Ambispora gerdemannii TaxID=144530 RepID=A0A9N9D8A3_9GLOM|nr:13547_t:CDS:1 [Ambispora gerdemannii]
MSHVNDKTSTSTYTTSHVSSSNAAASTSKSSNTGKQKTKQSLQQPPPTKRTYTFVELLALRLSPMCREIECRFAPDALYMDILSSQMDPEELEYNWRSAQGDIVANEYFVVPGRRLRTNDKMMELGNLGFVNELIRAHNRWIALLQTRGSLKRQDDEYKKESVFGCKKSEWVTDHMKKTSHEDGCVAIQVYQQQQIQAKNQN